MADEADCNKRTTAGGRPTLALKSEGCTIQCTPPLLPIPLPIPAPPQPFPYPLPAPPDDERTPQPPLARYAKANPPVPTTVTRPGKTRRSPDIVLEGRIVGTMYHGPDIHHYRVRGDDGIVYCCPPHWLPDDPMQTSDEARTRQLIRILEELPALWAARRVRKGEPA